MRTWTKSACVVLAWTILSITLVTTGMKGSVHPAQATMRTASSTEDVLTSTLTIAAPSVTATDPATRYVVQPGDTLSSIAARFAVRGGWPALYTLNLKALGRNPNAIRPGTVLTVPGRAPVRYTVATGDTLSRIAARLGVHGGWPSPVRGQPAGYRPRSEYDPARHRAHRPAPGGGTVCARPRPAAAPGSAADSATWVPSTIPTR